MSWHAKTVSLASDEGLKDLTTETTMSKTQLFAISWL